MNFSERVYRRLLQAYPEAYRKEYAEAMAQLFRDLCRDAAARRGTAGLIGVWGFLLQDLMGSLIREHRAEGRKTVNALYRKISAGRFVNNVLSSMLSLGAQALLVAGVFKLTSLPLTEGQLIVGILSTVAVSLQLIILAVLTAPPKVEPSPAPLKE